MKPAATVLGSVFLFFTLPTILWANATIRLEPADLTLAIGEKKIVQVVVDIPAPSGSGDPQGLAAFQLTVNFNPAVVHIGNPNEAFRGAGITPFAPLGGNPFCAIVRGVSSCPDPSWFLTSTGRTAIGQDTIDNVNGMVQIAYGTSGTSLPPTGSGVIALLEVVGQGNGCTSLAFGT